MIIPAAIEPRQPRQDPKRGPIQPKILEPRPMNGADGHDVAQAVLAGKLHAQSECAERHPFVRKALDLRIRKAAQREHHDGPAALDHGFGHRNRKRTGAADDSERLPACVSRLRGGFRGRRHQASSSSPDARGVVKRRLPVSRTNCTSRWTCLSSGNSAATLSAHSNTVPGPANNFR